MSELRTTVETDLRLAMKRRDSAAVTVLRIVLAAMANAEAVDPDAEQVRAGLLGDVARRELTEDDLRRIIAVERDDARHSAAELRRHGATAEADDLEAKADLLDRYLVP